MAASRNIDHFMESITTNPTSSSSSNTHPNSLTLTIRNHFEYYIPGGDLFILVDDTLFHVHSYFFHRESIDWRNLLETTTSGCRADAPLMLNDEFALYPPMTPILFGHFLWDFL